MSLDSESSIETNPVLTISLPLVFIPLMPQNYIALSLICPSISDVINIFWPIRLVVQLINSILLTWALAVMRLMLFNQFLSVCLNDFCVCSGSTMFSTCSGQDFENLVLRGGGLCLLNPPTQDHVISVAACGNGILEGTEQCDCGSPQVHVSLCCWGKRMWCNVFWMWCCWTHFHTSLQSNLRSFVQVTISSLIFFLKDFRPS